MIQRLSPAPHCAAVMHGECLSCSAAAANAPHAQKFKGSPTPQVCDPERGPFTCTFCGNDTPHFCIHICTAKLLHRFKSQPPNSNLCGPLRKKWSPITLEASLAPITPNDGSPSLATPRRSTISPIQEEGLRNLSRSLPNSLLR